MFKHLRRLPLCLKPAVSVALLLALLRPLRGMGQPTEIFFGDPSHPVVSGEAWLIANRWGGYQAVLVGTIREGRFEPRKTIQYPQYWEQADDYKLLLAVSNLTVEPPMSLETDDAYGWYGRRPEYLHDFPTIYLSVPLPKENRGKDWETSFRQMGHPTGRGQVLPLPGRRTIRLIYPDGKPLGGSRVSVSLYGSNANHCGVPVGIWLGDYVTNADGKIFVTAPKSSLALTRGFYEEHADGRMGTTFVANEYLIIGGEPATTVK